MSRRATLTTLVNLPSDLAAAWLQHVRDFDVKHPDCRFRIIGEVPAPTDEMEKILRDIYPSFDEIMIIAKGAVEGGDKDEKPKSGSG